MGGTIVSILSFLVYASILTPSEIGIATMFLAASMGLGQIVATIFQDPLVCAKNVGIKRISSIFWGGLFLSLFVAIFLILGVFIISSDLIYLELTLLSSLLIPILFFNSIYMALLRRRQKFKVLAQRMLLGKLAGALTGVLIAFNGMGALSMIAQAVAIELFALLALVKVQRLRLSIFFSIVEFRSIVNMGIAVALRKLSWEGYIKGLPLIIGGFLGASAVGVFAFAWRIVDMPRTALVSGAISYALPLFSKHNDTNDLSRDFQHLNRISMMCFAPLFVGLALVAEPLLTTFFGDKWVEAIPIVQGLAIYSLISFSRMYVPSVLTALFLPKSTLMTDIISTCVGLFVCAITLPVFGLNAVFFSLLSRLLVNFPISVIEVKKRLGLSLKEQFMVYSKTFMSIIVMASTLLIYQNYVELSGILDLISVVILGCGVYTFTLIFMDRTYLLELIRSK